MRRTKAALGQRRGYLDMPEPINLPHTPLFWVVHASVVKLATLRTASHQFKMLMRHSTQCRPSSQRWKNVEPDLVLVYSLGQKRENKARIIILQVALIWGLLVAAAIPAI